MPCQVRTSATPGARLRVPQAARPAQRPLPGTRCGGAGAACVLGSCLEHRTRSFAVCSSDSGGAKPASWRMYSSRRRLYLSSRRCPASVISCLVIGPLHRVDLVLRLLPQMNRRASPGHGVPGVGPPRRRAAPPCSPPENGGILAAALRRRPSPTHPGTASGSAPASRHSHAAWRASGSSSSPSDAPSRIPATSASRSARPPASLRSSATAAASSSLLSSRHLALCRASPQIWATSIRSACGRLSIMRSSIASSHELRHRRARIKAGGPSGRTARTWPSQHPTGPGSWQAGHSHGAAAHAACRAGLLHPGWIHPVTGCVGVDPSGSSRSKPSGVFSSPSAVPGVPVTPYCHTSAPVAGSIAAMRWL